MTNWRLPTLPDDWQATPITATTCTLPDDTVHLWAFTQDQPLSIVQQLQDCLNDEEHGRASRYYTSQLQNRYRVRRGVLRHLLAAYLGIAPAEIRFSYGEQGKPALVNSPLAFNLSDADALVLIGIARRQALGVDIERVQSLPELRSIAKHQFSSLECRELFSLPPDEQPRAFYRCWTRKEAFIKADSRGLSLPLECFDVTLLPDDPARLRRVDVSGWRVDDWQLAAVPMSADYVGAFAITGQMPQVRYHTLML